MPRFLLTVLACILLITSQSLSAEEKRTGKEIYRYKNSDGVVVMDSKIPPEYVSNGYEIISRSGKVLKKVSPMPKGVDAERLRRERDEQDERAREDQQLQRSYSNVADIDAAKIRSLDSLRGNMKILEASLVSVRSKLQSSRDQAAAIERSGRPLPEELVKNINTFLAQEKDFDLMINQRKEELVQEEKRFDEDRARFIEITKKPSQ